IFGGKLTDCINVGEEVCARARELGVVLHFADRVWYGEPPEAVRDEYFHQARLMDLDALTSPSASEKLSTRLWRRYGAEALGLQDPLRRRRGGEDRGVLRDAFDPPGSGGRSAAPAEGRIATASPPPARRSRSPSPGACSAALPARVAPLRRGHGRAARAPCRADVHPPFRPRHRSHRAPPPRC